MPLRAAAPSAFGHGSLRGTVLLPGLDGSVDVLDDGEVSWRDGRITGVHALAATDGDAPRMLLVPGFVDLHCHWPQAHVRGAFSGQLLDWLRESIWPAEAAFRDLAVAAGRAVAFLDDAVRAGTCAGLLFGPPFLEATLAFLELAPRGFFDGPALMECNGPEALLRPVGDTLEALAGLPRTVRDRLVLSPRFAPTLTAAGLHACGQAAVALGMPVQSHVSENRDEIAWVHALFPDARDYTDVYDRAGLLGPRTILAHGVHLTDRELARLAETRTTVAHCPTSNEALHSGRMPIERLRAAGVPWVLATDVGAGPQLSQLDVMRGFLAAHEGHADVSAAEALCRCTAIPGAFLARLDPALDGLGTFRTGAPAHVVALPHPHAGGFGRGDGHLDAESLLRGVLAAPAEYVERLPLEVVHWGRIDG